MSIRLGRPALYNGGVFRLKHISTKEKKYFAWFTYKLRVIQHHQPHRTKAMALEQAERIVSKLIEMEKKNVQNLSGPPDLG